MELIDSRIVCLADAIECLIVAMEQTNDDYLRRRTHRRVAAVNVYVGLDALPGTSLMGQITVRRFSALKVPVRLWTRACIPRKLPKQQ
jgi:hypothetical protein